MRYGTLEVANICVTQQTRRDVRAHALRGDCMGALGEIVLAWAVMMERAHEGITR